MTDPRLGTTLDRYYIEGVIGEGGMATVYRVRHTDLGTLHALKLLKHHSKAIADRMLQEGRIQARLRHPNIVAVTDVVRDGNDVGLVMDYIDGLPLGMVTYHLALSPAQLDELAVGLCAGVGAAHELGLVHRDLKLDNIMMAITEGPLVPRGMAFGLAKAVRDELRVGRSTRAGSMMGTPAFMAPEQYRDSSAVDLRADIYSVGAILYEAISGEPVFPDEDLPVLLAKCQTGDWKPLDEVAPDARPSWVKAVHACLEIDPAARPQSMAEVAQLWEAQPIPEVTWDEAQVVYLRKLQEVPETAPPAVVRSKTPGAVGSPRPSPTVQAGTGGTVATDDGDEAEVVAVDEGESTSRGVWLAVAAAVAMVLVGGMTGLGLLGAALGLRGWPGSGSDEVVTVEPVVDGDGDGAAAVDGGATSPEQPAPAVPAAAPVPATTPDPAPATAPAPAPAPAPSPTAPAPAPVVVPVPAPPAPTEAPAPAAPAGATVSLPGYDGYLMQGNQRFPLTGVPPGTYDLYVFFDGQVPSLAGEVTLAGEQTASMRCDKRSKICR